MRIELNEREEFDVQDSRNRAVIEAWSKIKKRVLNNVAIAWKSKIGRIVARITIEVEAISLREALEMALFLREVRREISGVLVYIAGRTDSKTLARAIGSNAAVNHRRLRIDLAVIREAIEDGDMREVMSIGGREQVADCLTKIGGREWLLLEYIMETKGEEERGIRLMEY